MRVEKRTYSNGTEYYSIVYYDGQKKVRLKQSEHPSFQSYQEAKSWADAKTAQHDCLKARAQRRLEWKTQYYNFDELSEEYIKSCKKSQPNSWKNTQIYLYHYIFDFFLNYKKENNPNNWSLYFEDFKDWLEEEALTLKKPQRVISYSTKNHCIKTLNTFLDFLLKRGKADPTSVYKLSGFAKSKLGSRDADALIAPEEFQLIYTRLCNINELVAVFYQTAYFTGMRFNEIFGLSMNDLYPGKILDEVLHKALEKAGIEYFGYIVLESQPKLKTRVRNEDGSIDRKPLKSKKVIHEKYNRIIPIINKDLYNNLVKLYKEQEKLYQNRLYGSQMKDYMLFDNLSTSAPPRALDDAYKGLAYERKSFHSCRHTRATELVGQTMTYILARYWLGHSRQETTDRYTHIFQQSVRRARSSQKDLTFI